MSNQLSAGTPVNVVKGMAAYRALAVTSLYSHSSDEARRAAAHRVQIGLPPIADSITTGQVVQAEPEAASSRSDPSKLLN